MSEEPQENSPDSRPIQDPTENASQPTTREVAEIIASRIVETRSEHYGPLPPPSDLQEYDNVVPGAAERIIRMAENQSEHRRELERKVVFGDSTRAFCGL